jgi:hypothetical protein
VSSRYWSQAKLLESAIAYIDAVDIHGDWLRLQTSIDEITRQIDARLQMLQPHANPGRQQTSA